MTDKVKVLVEDIEDVYLQTPVFINPTQLLDQIKDPKIKQHQILLSGYLKYHERVYESAITEFIQGKEYPLIIYDEKNSTKKIGIILSLTLTYRMKDNLIWPCYNVYDQNESPNAEGTFANVFKVGTLSYNIYNLLSYSDQKKRRVAKIFDHINERSILINFDLKNGQTRKNLKILPADAEIESKLCKAATHLHSKNIVFKENKEKIKLSSWIVMRECPGLPLSTVIHNDATGQERLTSYQRYWLCFMLARALKWQVHKKKIIHRDVKSGNIMVYITKSACEVNFIDFGLAIDANNIDLRTCGTLSYAAPEVIFKTHRMGYLTDSYSLGIAMSEIWGASIQNPKQFFASASFLNLFEKIVDCTNDDKIIIKKLLSDYTAFSRNDRLKNSIGVKRWDMAFFDYRTRDFPEKRDVLTKVHCLGNQILKQLDQLGLDLITNPIEDLVTIRNIFENILSQKNYDPIIFDQSLVVEEFILTIQIKALKNINHPKDIFNIINNIINAFAKINETLLDILQKVKINLCLIEFVSNKQYYEKNKNYLENLLLLTQAIIDKPTHRKKTLDNFVNLTISLSKKIDELNKYLIEFDQLFAAHSAFSTVKTYADLYKRLRMRSEDDNLSKLKNHVVQAIKYYLDLTLTPENITKDNPNRAASERRRQDMKIILDHVDEQKNFDMLKQTLQCDMKAIETGIFGRSKLNSLVSNAIKSTDNEIKNRHAP